MPGAVHRLQSKDIVLHREGEHVVAVVLPVSRRLPQFTVVDIGGGYFLKASAPVFTLQDKNIEFFWLIRSRRRWPAVITRCSKLTHLFKLQQMKSCDNYLAPSLCTSFLGNDCCVSVCCESLQDVKSVKQPCFCAFTSHGLVYISKYDKLRLPYGVNNTAMFHHL